MQYSFYNEGDYYDWHSDQHGVRYTDGMIRKLSFAIVLNEDYEGGEFEVATLSGAKELPKINVLNLNKKDGLSKGSMVVFPSYIWHRVTPVTKGVRKSLVGWVVGKPFV